MQSNYKTKRLTRRGDYYGDWTNGVQTRSERIAGRTLTYNHRTRTWI